MGSAVISECGLFRYELHRDLEPQLHGPRKLVCMFTMLNPSTADAEENDATVRKLLGFCSRWGATKLLIGNVYAFRTRHPKLLKECGFQRGPGNDYHLQCMAREADVHVCGWGANARAEDAAHTLNVLREAGAKPMALRFTKSGAPEHPLFVPYAEELKPMKHCDGR